MKNTGWLYYREYYRSLEQNDRGLQNFVKNGALGKKDDVFFERESDTLLQTALDGTQTGLFPTGTHQLSLETAYPGLLVGSGYSHQTGSLGEFKLGFFFDHTTGLPVIPGSSVKGLLRSAFPNREKRGEMKQMKAGLVRELLADIRPDLANVSVQDLENLIFEGKKGQETLPMSEHDVFLDAFITASHDKKKRIFADDYITPHSVPLKNPVPVRFLKVRPQVVFQFNFILHDSQFGDWQMLANEKRQLFEQIIRLLGIGAKTNVGYGQFKP